VPGILLQGEWPGAADYNTDSKWRRGLKDTIRRWIIGSPLESVARKVYAAIYGAPGAAASDLNTLYDAQTAAVMARVLERRSNCVDVGCHQGAILDVMLRLAPRGRHLAFEPLPHMYAALSRKYAGAANVSLHELAFERHGRRDHLPACRLESRLQRAAAPPL
jgi:hypothetical protein